MSSNTIRRTGLLSACGAAAALIALAGCSTSESASSTSQAVASSQVKTSGESTAGSSAEAAAHNAADVSFNQMMIPHHQQAVEMSETLLAKDDIPPVSYTHLTLPTTRLVCRSRWSPYH